MSCASKGQADSPVLAEVNLFTAALDSFGRLSLSGRLDANGIDTLRAILDQALLEPGNEIVVNGSRLTSIDLFASKEILEYQALAARSRRQLWLEAVPNEVTSEILGFNLQALLTRP